jgi:ribosome-binding protein aMBF1 (putative translation factor)
MARKRTSDAVKILHSRVAGDRKLDAALERSRVNARVAQLIYDARTAAKLTQQELASLVGTTQPVISRLEDADYNGHSLTMLQRIAIALRKRLDIGFIDSAKEKKAA